MKAHKLKTANLPVEPLLTWKFPSKLLAVLFVPWSLTVLILHFQRFPVRLDYFLAVMDEFSRSQLIHPYMLKALGALMSASWLAWLAFQLGDWVLMLSLRENRFTNLERVVFGSAVGLGLFSFMALALGALQIWYAAVVWGVLGSLTAFFIVSGRYGLKNKSTASTTISSGSNVPGIGIGPAPWRSVWVTLLGIFLVLIALGDLTPEIFYDALYYHIAVPNQYLLNHRLYAIPTLLVSNFVLIIQMLYGLALTVGNVLTAKLMHGWMSFLLVLAFLSFGRRYLSPGAGLLSAVIFLSMPFVCINVISTGTDVGGSFFQFMAGYALVWALSQSNRRALALAGLLTGLAACCKYPAFPAAPLAGLVVLWKRRGDEQLPWGKALYDAGYFLIFAFFVFLPHLLKNTVFHGNPIYPFGGTVLGSPRLDPHYWKLFVSDGNARSLSQAFSSRDAIVHFLLHPWFITLQGGGNGDFVGPMYLLFLPLLFFVRTRSLAFVTFRRYALLLWLTWMATSTTPRYGLPALTLVAPLLAEAILTGCRSRMMRFYLLGTVLFVGVANLYQLVIVMYTTGGWQVLGGLSSEYDYLSNTHATYPIPPYAGIDWMNHNLPAHSKILFVGEPRSYYIRFPVIPSAAFDPQPLMIYARQAHNGAEFAQILRQQNVTHLFLNYTEAVRTEGYGLFPFDKNSWDVLADFWSHDVKMVWKSEAMQEHNPRALYVYELLSDQEAKAPHEAPVNLFQRWMPHGSSGQ